MACETDYKIPDGVDCKELCNVNEACHPHGLDDTEHNIHNWYDDLSTIPEHFFANTKSFQKLKNIIQKCFKARDRCEKCIQKNIRAISSTPHLISDKIKGYWYRVYLGLEGKTPAMKIGNTERLIIHILERDKAKILYDVVILNKRPPHHDLIGPSLDLPKPRGANNIFRIFKKMLNKRNPELLKDWEVVQMAPAPQPEAQPEPEAQPQPENQSRFKDYDEEDDSDNECLEDSDEEVSKMSKSSRPIKKINRTRPEYILFKKLDKDNLGFINIDSSQWKIVLNLPLNIVQQIYESLDILDGIITMEQFINGYNIITTAIDNYMLDEAIRLQSQDKAENVHKPIVKCKPKKKIKAKAKAKGSQSVERTCDFNFLKQKDLIIDKSFCDRLIKSMIRDIRDTPDGKTLTTKQMIAKLNAKINAKLNAKINEKLYDGEFKEYWDDFKCSYPKPKAIITYINEIKDEEVKKMEEMAAMVKAATEAKAMEVETSKKKALKHGQIGIDHGNYKNAAEWLMWGLGPGGASDDADLRVMLQKVRQLVNEEAEEETNRAAGTTVEEDRKMALESAHKLYEEGRYDSAKSWCEWGLDPNDDDEDVELQEMLKKVEKALEERDKLEAKIDFDRQEARTNANKAYEDGKYSLARSWCQMGLDPEVDPDDVELQELMKKAVRANNEEYALQQAQQLEAMQLEADQLEVDQLEADQLEAEDVVQDAGGSKKKRKRKSRKRTKRVKYNGGGGKLTKRRNKRNTRKKSHIKMNISEKTYNKLLDMKKNKKTLSKSQQKNLDKALNIKYCSCVKSLKYSQKNPAAYGICTNSVYKNRGFDMPPSATKNCNK